MCFIVGGFAVRPFIRKSYGLARAHSLLTSPDIDTETVRFLGRPASRTPSSSTSEQRRVNAAEPGATAA